MPVEKPEIFSGFLRFSPFSSLFQNSILSKNKKMPNADFDLVRGIGLVERYFRAVFWEFFSPKTALFSFFTKNFVKFLCLRKEVFRIAYRYKKEDCDCNYWWMNPHIQTQYLITGLPAEICHWEIGQVMYKWQLLRDLLYFIYEFCPQIFLTFSAICSTDS